ncbi:MAG: M28 family metallopeptidase [Promethearchaeota archaeon]
MKSNVHARRRDKQETKDFSKELKSIVDNISFPRHAGTKGDAKIRAILKGMCEGFRLNPKEETFNASNLFMYVVNRIPYFVFGLFILAFTIINIFFTMPIISIVFGCGLLLISFCMEGIIRALKYPVIFKSKEQYQTGNIIVSPDPMKLTPKDAGSNKVNIFLVAHSDSKSEKPNPHVLFLIQAISISFGTWIYCLHAIIFSIILEFSCESSMQNMQFRYFFLYGFVLGVIDATRVFTRYGNESDGACDDATGVAVVLLLIREIKNVRFKNIRVIGLITGAEEVGEVGAYSFIKKHHDDLPRNLTEFIIVDGLKSKNIKYSSTFGLKFKTLSKLLTSTMKTFLESGGVKSSCLNVKATWIPPPVNTDHSAFIKFGYPAMILTSTEVVSHTKKDTSQNIDYDALSDFLNFMLDYLDFVDNHLEP